MTNTRRMGVRNFGTKRLPRHLRNEELPRDNFTARTYQVELLDTALHRNTIISMGYSGRIFIAVLLMKEMAQSIRKPLSEGGKRTVFLVNTVDMIEQQASALQHQTDLEIVCIEEKDDSCNNVWTENINKSEVLLTTGSYFLEILQREIIHIDQVNLLIFDECHLVVENHPYAEIMNLYSSVDKPAQPRILGLTSAILSVKKQNPEELGEIISAVEKGLQSTAETSTLVLFERYGVKPREEVVECDDYEDTTGLSDQLADILENAIDFLDECNIEISEDLDNRDPMLIPKAALIECHNVLRELGPWCAACLADMLVGQIEKIEKQKEFVALHKKFLNIGATNLRMVSKIFEKHFNTCEYSVEELLKYSSPKVTSLMNALRVYRPETEFVIISEDIENERKDQDDDDVEDDDAGNEINGNDSDMSDSDFSDNEDIDAGNKSESSKHVHVAIKKVPDDSKPADPFALDEDKYLCGLVFVEDQHKAYALNKFIEEVCSWDEGLCFVKSMHLTGKIERQKKLYKKQEEILRKFRMQELNLLISTNILEEGVDIPKCNFVCRFDAPKSYKSYSLSKGRARARDAAYVILIEEEHFDEFTADLKTYSKIEKVLIGRCRRDSMDEETSPEPDEDDLQVKPYVINTGDDSLSVTLDSAIMLVNRYCAKLPSDAFTHLTPTCKVTQVQHGERMLYKATLRLPINSPIKQDLEGTVMCSKLKAKQAVALKMCEVLHKAGELDDNLMPIGKEMFQVEEEEEDVLDEEEDLQGEARPGTTKRKQYYCKKVCGALLHSAPSPKVACKLYVINMTLTGAITDEQNTRGRRIYAPEESPRGFGILTPSYIPLVPLFPVFTRSGEVTVSVELMISNVLLDPIQLEKLHTFHRFLISNVLRLEKDAMEYQPQDASVGYILVPLNEEEKNDASLTIDWAFTDKVVDSQSNDKKKEETFTFKQAEFEDAVVMPSYRNMDQPQYFYVAEIRHDLNPQSPFPSPELYKTFAEYYTTKYGLKISNVDQPLLDVDHTSARLNLLIPRYMNQKGVALPTSSAETKKARRENLQQKQILIPELCDIHVFPASLWRKAVCLPAILYRMNYLLLAEEIRKNVAKETKIGIADLNESYRFPRLDFGFDTNPENLKTRTDEKSDSDEETDTVNLKGNVEVDDEDLYNEKHHETVSTKENNLDESGDCKNSCEKNSNDSIAPVTPNKDINVGVIPKDIDTLISSDKDTPQKEIHIPNDYITSGETKDSKTKSNTENHDENEPTQHVEVKEDETIDCEGAIKTSGYFELQRDCDNSNTRNISSAKPPDLSGNTDNGEGLEEADLHFVFHNNMEHPSTAEFIDGRAKCNGDCDKYRDNSENLQTFPDRGWDEDTINDDVDETSGSGTQPQCSICSALSAEIGIDNLKVTNCPECYKLRSEKATNVQNGDSSSLPTENSGGLTNGRSYCAETEISNNKSQDVNESNSDDETTKVKPIQTKELHNKLSNAIESNDNETKIVKGLNNFENKNGVVAKKASEVDISKEHLVNGDNTSGESDSEFNEKGEQLHCCNSEIQAISEKEKSMDKSCVNSEFDSNTSELLNKEMHLKDKRESVIFKLEDNLNEKGHFDVLKNENNLREPNDGATAVEEDDNTTEQVIDVFDNISKFYAKPAKKSPKRLEDYEFPEPLIYMDEDVDMSTFVGPSPCVVLQALTMSNANDFFSLERLETIGDSFLKYAITVYLYCSYPGIHEGKLSYLRSKQVSNYNLYRLGKRKGLGECMISTKFEPYENWLPPGYVVNEDRRKGPVPKVCIASLSTRTSPIFGNGSTNQSKTKEHSVCKQTILLQSEMKEDSSSSNQSEMKEYSIGPNHSSIVKELVVKTIHDNIKETEAAIAHENAEMLNFFHDMEEIDQIEEEEENEKGNDHLVDKNVSTYCLQIHHCLPDKSLADSVEALIGCYLTSCDKMAALKFMSWMGLKVLPVKDKSSFNGNSNYVRLPCPPSPFLNLALRSGAVLEHLLEGYEGFERKIGYTFKDRAYLLQAFTHASYHYNTVTDCYQRLEFLGDAVLDYVITRHLYEDSDKYTPGVLTDLRSALVNNNIFAALAVKWDFHKYFKAISPSLFYVIEKFVARQKDKEDEIDETDVDDEEHDNDQEKEHVELEVPKALGDIFESVAGAIYLDSGMSLDAVWRVFYRIMKTQIDKYLKDIPKSPVRELLEQEPETAKFDKPERTMDGKIRVTVNVVGKGVFTGVGRNYRIAKSAAAKKALRCIKTLEQQGLI